MTAIEERDGFRFYVDKTAPLAPIRLIRTPGLMAGCRSRPTQPDERGRDHERRQEVADLDVLDVEQLERDPDDRDAARRGEHGQRLADEQILEQAGAERDRALDQQDRHGGQPDAPAERRGQRDRGEAVEHRLRREQLVVAGQAVLDRADDGERADAEQQRRGDEPLGDRRVCSFAPRSRSWRRSPSALQPALDPDRLADDAAEQDPRRARRAASRSTCPRRPTRARGRRRARA